MDNIQDFCYQLDADGVCICSYEGKNEAVVIPSYIDHHPVVRIGGFAFSYQEGIQSVVIPEGVREIEIGAFEGCSALQRVVIPESVTEIGEGAFRDCGSLQSVEIPAGVRELEHEVFSNCSSLGSIVLHQGLERIGGTFDNCTALTAVILPDSVARSVRSTSGEMLMIFDRFTNVDLETRKKFLFE